MFSKLAVLSEHNEEICVAMVGPWPKDARADVAAQKEVENIVKQ